MNVFKTSKHNHFELIRFDMILDKDLNVYVIEVNQHPNLYPTIHFARNQYLYENLVYNLFNLIGAGTTYAKSDLRIPSMEVEMMIAEEHSTSVKPELCMSEKCRLFCSDECLFCRQCIDSNDYYEQVVSYREQMNVGDFKRIFPPALAAYENIDEKLWKQVSWESRMLARWFRELCERNNKFC